MGEGVGVNKVHYGLCENGEFMILVRIEQNVIFSEILKLNNIKFVAMYNGVLSHDIHCVFKKDVQDLINIINS